MITREQYLMGRDVDSPLTLEMEANLERHLKAVNSLEEICGIKFEISSGYRPAKINAAVGGAKKSKHMLCLAIDLKDKDGKIDEWCVKSLGVLASMGLYLEHPDATPGWCHLQSEPPRSGRQVFKP